MKSIELKVLITSTLLLGAGALGTLAQQSDGDRPGRTEYIETGCYECHGYEGQGGPGPRLAPDPMPWEAFAMVVRKPPSVMPAYSPKVLSDTELELIYDFVKSIPPPPEVSSIPILAAEE